MFGQVETFPRPDWAVAALPLLVMAPAVLALGSSRLSPQQLFMATPRGVLLWLHSPPCFRGAGRGQERVSDLPKVTCGQKRWPFPVFTVPRASASLGPPLSLSRVLTSVHTAVGRWAQEAMPIEALVTTGWLLNTFFTLYELRRPAKRPLRQIKIDKETHMGLEAREFHPSA